MKKAKMKRHENRHENIMAYENILSPNVKQFDFICRGCTIRQHREDLWHSFHHSNAYPGEDNTYFEFEDEPDNEYDPNAIMIVMRGEHFGTCGYVAKETTLEIKKILDICEEYRLDMIDEEQCGNREVKLRMTYREMSEEDKELCRRIADAKAGRNMHEHELIEEPNENKITLIEKPVTIGDTVYFVLHDTAPFVKGTDNEYEIIKTQITDVSVNHGFTLSCDRPEMFRDWSEFGTTVFLSRKEAEESIK